MRGHYFHQDLLVAQLIFDTQPAHHIDVGSRTDGFVAHVAAFRSLDVADIRSADSAHPRIRFIQADLMQPPTELFEKYESVSCLHALEHFGLGRYGDPIDFDGYKKGFSGLTHLIKRGGVLYLGLPIGPQRIEFNAHRVFSLKEIESLYQQDFKLSRFWHVNDDGNLLGPTPLLPFNLSNELWYGCGIFELVRNQN